MHFFVSSILLHFCMDFCIFLHAALEVQLSIDKSTAKRNDNSFAERKSKKKRHFSRRKYGTLRHVHEK